MARKIQGEEKKTILDKITEIQVLELKQYQNLAEKEELASLEKTKKEEKKKLLDLQEILKPLLFKKIKLFKSYQELDKNFCPKTKSYRISDKRAKNSQTNRN